MSTRLGRRTVPFNPRATAAWLIDNTGLTFQQIADFCAMDFMEIQGIADGDITDVRPMDPIMTSQLDRETISYCEKFPDAKLVMSKSNEDFMDIIDSKRKKSKFTPIIRRRDKPDAIAWLIKQHPYLTDAQIVKLVGTTKETVNTVRDKTHWNSQNIKPKNPVLLGICTQDDLEQVLIQSKAIFDRNEALNKIKTTIESEKTVDHYDISSSEKQSDDIKLDDSGDNK